MNSNRIIWLAVIFIIISLAYTGYSYFQKDDSKKEKYKNYVSAKAVVDEQLPVHVTRHGVKSARYNITIIDAKGEKIIRFNCELAGSPKEKDTVTVYYDPNDPNGSEVTQY